MNKTSPFAKAVMVWGTWNDSSISSGIYIFYI